MRKKQKFYSTNTVITCTLCVYFAHKTHMFCKQKPLQIQLAQEPFSLKATSDSCGLLSSILAIQFLNPSASTFDFTIGSVSCNYSIHDYNCKG